MKAQLFDLSGNKKSEIALPALFDTPVREDLIFKYFESEHLSQRQPYATWEEAGKRHSASGRLSHRRHKWKTQYGKGQARIPKKTMWRRGTQFNWVGAEVSNTRGGRVSHPPQGLLIYRKINKKEKTLAMHSALASVFNSELISNRYASLHSNNIQSAVIESLPGKTSELISSVKKIFGEAFNLVLKNKVPRAGKGKSRGRKYKSNAGLLLITSEKEKNSFKGMDVKPASAVQISDFYPLGRLTLFTKQSLNELSKDVELKK
ncbi:MAG: 50S ribosomal protein L4 [Nanoarchaeota archaeon]